MRRGRGRTSPASRIAVVCVLTSDRNFDKGPGEVEEGQEQRPAEGEQEQEAVVTAAAVVVESGSLVEPCLSGTLMMTKGRAGSLSIQEWRYRDPALSRISSSSAS